MNLKKLKKEQQQLATHPLHAQQTAARTAQPAHKPRTAHTVQRDSAIAFLIVPAANLSLWPALLPAPAAQPPPYSLRS